MLLPCPVISMVFYFRTTEATPPVQYPKSNESESDKVPRGSKMYSRKQGVHHAGIGGGFQIIRVTGLGPMFQSV